MTQGRSLRVAWRYSGMDGATGWWRQLSCGNKVFTGLVVLDVMLLDRNRSNAVVPGLPASP
jgi:hypothetical protein